jgi:hypothetical protein
VEALQAGAQHRAVGLVEHAPGDVHDPARIDAEDVAVERQVVDRAQRQPVTTAAMPVGSTSGTMWAAWTSVRSRSAQIAQRCR